MPIFQRFFEFFKLFTQPLGLVFELLRVSAAIKVRLVARQQIGAFLRQSLQGAETLLQGGELHPGLLDLP